MKNVLKSLKRMRTLMFLIIVQLALGLAMLNSSTAIIEEASTKRDGFEKIFNPENTYAMRMNIIIENEEYDLEGYDIINKLYPDIMELKEENLMESCKILFPMLTSIKGIDDYIPSKLKDVQGLNPHRAKVLVNSDFIDDYQINMLEGRSLNRDDFKWTTEGTVPILIGYGYKDNINIGDTFTEVFPRFSKIGEPQEVEVKFEVVGIMERNSIPIMIAKQAFFESVEYSDYSVVIPANTELLHLSVAVGLGDQAGFVTTSNIDGLKVRMNEIAGDKISMQFTSLKDDYNSVMEGLTSEVTNSVILGFALTFLSVIGITAVLIGELKKRRKEMGMKLSCGATISILCKEMVGEIAIMLISSSILSILLMYVWNSGGQNIITPTLVGVNILAVIILTTLISIIPVLSIRKMNIVDLVRGK
ncbi:FtsX-like permease family protein [Clostridium sp.]|uniref:FtsX-like permease family protein n=1 Tax=Clostridium sp. TaxID=1506 RepID=UPI003217BDAC